MRKVGGVAGRRNAFSRELNEFGRYTFLSQILVRFRKLAAVFASVVLAPILAPILLM